MEFPNVSRSVAYKIVTEDLNFKKLCSRWVPRLLTAEDKEKRLRTGHIKSLIFNGSKKTYASCRCSAATSPSHIIAYIGASVGQLLNEEDVVFNLIKQQGLLDIV
ncbi:hypothetical protein TNCT_657131 [Trichonephila clavata]|uniref:Uncharacterized protein n=1 Tax=Trichonephila clavata TaxID=2740835 RepID=A0A8X6HAL4_TRICU|nr:hypothetical protein TNCT_657131 [Trichonephila clavata]